MPNPGKNDTFGRLDGLRVGRYLVWDAQIVEGSFYGSQVTGFVIHNRDHDSPRKV
jgi:hypothetical protein